jgi:hypothetical protein
MQGQRWARLETAGEEVVEHIDGRASHVEDEVGCMGYVPRDFDGSCSTRQGDVGSEQLGQ